MFLKVFDDKISLAKVAADQAAASVIRAIRNRGTGRPLPRAAAGHPLELLHLSRQLIICAGLIVE